MKHQSDAVFVGGGKVVVGEAAHVFDMEDFEDVVNAGDDLNVGFLRVHHVAALGERHQHAIALIFLEEGVVFRREVAPKHFRSDDFAPFQVFQQWYAIENLAAHVPFDVERGIAVVEKFHVVDEVERLSLDDVREVGGRHDEQRIGHLVPLRSSLGIDVDFSPRFHPKPLENGGFGEVVLVLSAEKSVETHRVRQREDGCFEIDGAATLFRVDERTSRGELKFDFGLGRAHLEVG